MIFTVTLNPAVDKTIEVKGFTVDNVNRVSTMRLDAGGKGINVSKGIASLGGKTLAMGILGGQSGQMIRNALDDLGIAHEFLMIPGETRTNLKVIDPINHTNTDINEPGLAVTSSQLARLEERIFSLVKEGDYVVFSGSIPSGVETDIYARWITKAKAIGAYAVLDADGPLLAKGVKAGPLLVKPNIHELERLFDRSIRDKWEAARLAKDMLREYDIGIVVVSLGKDGALFVDADRCLYAPAIKVAVRSTVGAGDAVVAALAFGLESGLPFEATARLAAASGTASVTMSGTQSAQREIILEFEKQVALEPLTL